MTLPRSSLVSAEETPYYHVFGRCVRRAYLCGYDEVTNRSFEHRRRWISERLRVLCDAFAIDLCAYAVMSNHYHLVVKLDPERTTTWSAREIVERWLTLFKGTDAARGFLNNETLNATEKQALNADITTWQAGLSDLSWFMRCLNESIARRANKEDKCKGHFWESRFKSQAVLDDIALLRSMAYVDLNPIRAKLAESIETSDYTSVQDRYRAQKNQPQRLPVAQRPQLLPFRQSELDDNTDALPFNLDDYLNLVDVTGRVIIEGKRGFIDGATPKLIQSFSINAAQWMDTVTQLQHRLELAIGTPEHLQNLANRWGKRWLQGIGVAKRLYPTPAG